MKVVKALLVIHFKFQMMLPNKMEVNMTKVLESICLKWLH